MTFLNEIVVTQDSHPQFHVGVPRFWKNRKGASPEPMKPLAPGSINDGFWRPFADPVIYNDSDGKPVLLSEDLKRMEDEVVTKQGGALFVWNPHCEFATSGRELHPKFVEAFRFWERSAPGIVYPRIKGMCFARDAYSFVRAVHPFPGVAETFQDTNMLQIFVDSDEIYVMGLALNFCVAAGACDIIMLDPSGTVGSKMIILKDCVKEIPGVPHPSIPNKSLTDVFVEFAKSRGVRFMTSSDAIDMIKSSKERRRRTALCVDFNLDFVLKTGALSVPDGEDAVENSARFITELSKGK